MQPERNLLRTALAKLGKWLKVGLGVLGILAFFWLLNHSGQVDAQKDIRIRDNWTYIVQMRTALNGCTPGDILVFRKPGYYGKFAVIVSVYDGGVSVMPGPENRTVINQPVRLHTHDKSVDLLNNEVERIVKKNDPDWPTLMREFYSH